MPQIGNITAVVIDMPTMDSLGKRFGAFGGWGMAAGKVVISGLDVDRSAEA
jgi:hypothetical protein